jgi:hypothetical protein
MSLSEDSTNSRVRDICLKTYTVGNDLLVAACDKELLGVTLFEDNVEFVVSEDFYCAVEGTVDLLSKQLQRATIANLVGERCVNCGIQLGVIRKENVLNIADVPHAQFALMI